MIRRTICVTAAATMLLLPLEAKEYDTVAETTYRQVTWEDFKGNEFRGSRFDDGSWAHIVSGIKLAPFQFDVQEIQADLWAARPRQIEAYAVMDKYLSGASRGATNDKVLAHEQLHFDVTEALARRLTVRLLTIEGQGPTAEEARDDLKRRVGQAYDEINQELVTYQGRYDSETAHGVRRKQQKKWSEKIGKLFAAAAAELEAARKSADPNP